MASAKIEEWVVSTTYTADEVVTIPIGEGVEYINKLFRCAVGHVASSFASDFGNGDWTEYYVSFDSNTFHRIMPAGTGNTKTNIPSVIKADDVYFELVIKAVLKRPTDTTGLSPAIRNIKINVETK